MYIIDDMGNKVEDSSLNSDLKNYNDNAEVEVVENDKIVFNTENNVYSKEASMLYNDIEHLFESFSKSMLSYRYGKETDGVNECIEGFSNLNLSNGVNNFENGSLNISLPKEVVETIYKINLEREKLVYCSNKLNEVDKLLNLTEPEKVIKKNGVSWEINEVYLKNYQLKLHLENHKSEIKNQLDHIDNNTNLFKLKLADYYNMTHPNSSKANYRKGVVAEENRENSPNTAGQNNVQHNEGNTVDNVPKNGYKSSGNSPGKANKNVENNMESRYKLGQNRFYPTNRNRVNNGFYPNNNFSGFVRNCGRGGGGTNTRTKNNVANNSFRMCMGRTNSLPNEKENVVYVKGSMKVKSNRQMVEGDGRVYQGNANGFQQNNNTGVQYVNGSGGHGGWSSPNVAVKSGDDQNNAIQNNFDNQTQNENTTNILKEEKKEDQPDQQSEQWQVEPREETQEKKQNENKGFKESLENYFGKIGEGNKPNIYNVYEDEDYVVCRVDDEEKFLAQINKDAENKLYYKFDTYEDFLTYKNDTNCANIMGPLPNLDNLEEDDEVNAEYLDNYSENLRKYMKKVHGWSSTRGNSTRNSTRDGEEAETGEEDSEGVRVPRTEAEDNVDQQQPDDQWDDQEDQQEEDTDEELEKSVGSWCVGRKKQEVQGDETVMVTAKVGKSGKHKMCKHCHHHREWQEGQGERTVSGNSSMNEFGHHSHSSSMSSSGSNTHAGHSCHGSRCGSRRTGATNKPRAHRRHRCHLRCRNRGHWSQEAEYYAPPVYEYGNVYGMGGTQNYAHLNHNTSFYPHNYTQSLQMQQCYSVPMEASSFNCRYTGRASASPHQKTIHNLNGDPTATTYRTRVIYPPRMK